MKPETPEASKGKKNYRQILYRQFWRVKTIFGEFMVLRTGTVVLQTRQSSHIFLIVYSTTQNIERRQNGFQIALEAKRQ